MSLNKRIIATLLIIAGCFTQPTHAQTDGDNELCLMAQLNNITSFGENAPYWFTANRQGLASLELHNAYLRLAATYSNRFGKNKQFGYKFIADLNAAYNQATPFYVHQANAEISWRWLTLSAGSKERYAELKDDISQFCGTSFSENYVNNLFPNLFYRNLTNLSSGGLIYSGNCRPIPQIRLEVPEYTTINGTNQWLHMKGHIAYGRFTDDEFQESFSRGNNITRYGKKILYHSKAVFLKVGKPQRFPLEMEGGLEMYSQFGGDIYTNRRGNYLSMPASFSDYMKAFIPMSGSKDTPLDEQTNISGNQIGAWHAAMTLHTKPVDVRIYGEHMFEDFSQLFFLEYQSNKEGVRRVIFYPWKDILVGVRITNKSGVLPFISALQYEYMGTYDQSGALYHDPSVNFNEQMDGVDNYYNHGIYPGWHHWGMGIGNPLVISPSYNNDGDLAFKSNGVKAHNVGINGNFGKRYPFAYRLQYTYSVNWGTYLNALEKKAYSNSLLGELVFAPRDSHWAGSIAVGYDNSNFIGNNFGVMISIVRAGSINFSKKK
jgi:hypothetical protein